jgi:predicted outer membrane protein
MRNVRSVVVFGLLLVPAFVVAGDAPRAASQTGWWSEGLERTFSDTLSFSKETMARVHYANRLATVLGRLAEESASSPEVRRYGRLLGADRQIQDAQVLDYASRRMRVALGEPQWGLEAERTLALRRAARLAGLRTRVGTDFDREFLALALDDNQSDMGLFDYARTQLDDPTLRIMFDKTMPILQQHEKIVQVLRSRAARATEGR